jgi:hypothetical protein
MANLERANPMAHGVASHTHSPCVVPALGGATVLACCESTRPRRNTLSLKNVWMFFSDVRLAGREFKVVEAVVVAYLVFVMHDLGSQQRSSEVPRHNVPVLQYVPGANAQLDIPVGVFVPPSFPPTVSFTGLPSQYTSHRRVFGAALF